MTINTYGSLKTAVASYLNRSDLTTYIQDFVQFGAQRIFYGGSQPFDSPPVRVPAMQAQDTGTVSGGYISFPTDFVEPIRIAAYSGTSVWQLDYQSLTSFLNEESTEPNWYTYRDNAIYTGVTGSADYVIDYYKSFTLSDDADTNWILTNAPSVYLYSSLIEAAPFLENDSRISVWFSLYKSAISGLNRSTQRQTSAMAVRLK